MELLRSDSSVEDNISSENATNVTSTAMYTEFLVRHLHLYTKDIHFRRHQGRHPDQLWPKVGLDIYHFLLACESFWETIASDYTDQNWEEMQRWLKKEPGVFDQTPIVKYISKSFREIIASDYSLQNWEEMQRWLKKEPGAFDWTPIVKYVCELEGDREKWPEKEEKLRRSIKQYLKCDVTQPNPLAPLVLPSADCLLSTLCFDGSCKDIPTYRSAFRNISSLLKPGGHLLFHSTVENNYYMVDQHRFSALYLEKGMVKEAVRQAGFVIKWIEETRNTLPPSLVDGKVRCVLLAEKCST
ncbi:nicotinamide N-methyltransferase-like [Pantherophis guttatus]|uniref:Nicotinamide N-methyltransferase-like n=1 Tax=Pantherophis guttatus TaxID=94885 RepID=A0A6P9CPF7_PANGU|nr:nicotinamide N-methyltransferase-like [Pantherophis guttatus]